MDPLAKRADRSKDAFVRLSPTLPGERIWVVDALRGLALLGILIENMAPYAGYGYDPQVGGPLTLRTVVGVAVLFVLEAKSYSLLALLLGWGAAVQARRAVARGARFAPFFLRRAGVLLVFGLAHGILIWFGDILILYALLSVVLLLLYVGARRFAPDKVDGVILALSLCALCLPILLALPGETLDGVRAWYEDLTSALRSGTYPESVYATGSFRQVLGRRIQDLARSWSWVLYYVGNVLSVILMGFYLGRKEVLSRAAEQTSCLRKMVWIGLGLGVSLNALYVASTLGLEHALGSYHEVVRIGSRTLGAPALVLALLAWLTLAARRRTWQRRLETVALAGRMSLSNYLFQSVVCTLLFYGYGLKLYAQVGPVFGLVLAVLLYAIQLRLSKWWLDRWPMGPAERLWRALTYGWGRLTTTSINANAQDRGRRLGRRRAWAGLLLGTLVVALLVVGVAVLQPEWLSRLGAKTPPEVRSSVPTSAIKSETVSATRDAGADVYPDLVSPDTSQSIQTAYQPGPLAASGDLVALASTLDPSSIQAKIEILTGSPYLGRYPASPGGRAAGDYIAEQFSAYGLQPVGDAGTFFQPFPVEYVALSSAPRLVVERADGTTIDRYVPYQDFATVLRWYSGSGQAEGPAVWANHCAREDFDLDVLKKVVLCQSTSIPEAQRYALEHGASGLLLLTDARERPPDFGSWNGEPWVPEPIPTFRVFSEVASDLVWGSGYSLPDLSTTFGSFELESRVIMQVDAISEEACPREGCLARNVLGVLPGRDPLLAHEVVVVGAHYDHLGESPDGTVWAGANDNASGVAVLLEIAQRWHEQGYIPRRTVLFGAWDAEEMGLLGSRHYVEHPRYSVENTVAMLQLDMVGDGQFPLCVDGEGPLADSLAAIADDLGIETSRTDAGRSDHVPFREAGVPASLLIWSYEVGPSLPAPSYHRPVDVASEIDLQKVEAASRVAGLALLALTEGEPALVDLVERRAQAATAGDLAAFLDTSSPDQWDLDEGWFSALQAVDPTAVDLWLTDARVLGRTATGTVRTEVEWTDAQGHESGSRTTMAVRFVHDGQRWQWAGPDLERVAPVELEPGAGPALDARFTVWAPPGRSSALLGTDRAVAQRYTRIAETMGLPGEIDAALMLFEQEPALWASVSPVQDGRGDDIWTGFRVAKMTYGSDMPPDADELDRALAHLALTEAGVPQEVAPWLWRGLPLAVRSELNDNLPTYLAPLEQDLAVYAAAGTLDAGSEAWTDATAWAAVNYLQNEIGWPALGRFVQSLGMACGGGDGQDAQVGPCSNPRALEEALSTIGYADAAAFDSAWQGHWGSRIRELRAGLDETLAARGAAVRVGDMEAFLRTVDVRIPQLAAEQQAWFDDLVEHPVEELVLEGQPLALHKDGFIADVTLSYMPTAERSRGRSVQVTTLIEFTAGQAGYLWAGAPFEAIDGESARLLYPGLLSERAESYRALAAELIPEAEWMLNQMADELDLELPEPLTLKIYEQAQDRDASIGLSLLSGATLSAGSVSRSSVKLSLSAESRLDSYRSVLAAQLARHLLYQAHVDSEWLVRGGSLYLASLVDGGIVRREAEATLDDLLKALTREQLCALAEMPPDSELTPSEIRIANAQTFDLIYYLIKLYGHGTLRLLVASQSAHDLDLALQRSTGHTLAELEADWSESLTHGHARPEWVEIAQAFDESAAHQHITVLTDPGMAGRQAGSHGAEQAAAYIAARFAEYGLVSMVKPSAGANASPASLYMQRFPISYTTFTSLPTLDLIDNQGQTAATLEYRQDFTAIVDPASGAGVASGGLVWIEGSVWGDIDLNGKIAVQASSESLNAQIDRAMRHNASALLLVGKRGGQRSLWSKQPLPVSSPLSQTLPVLELTPKGQERVLRAGGWTVGDLDAFPAAQDLDLDARLEVPLSPPVPVESANVLGLLPGTDPKLSKQVILIGAHYDHVGDDPDGVRYSGANDDASGVAVLLQIAQLWQQTGYRPKHSVLFVAWSAQEPGEVGSRFYIEHPLFPLDQTIAVIQLDAVGGGRGYFLEAQGDPDREGLLRFTIEAGEAWVDGRLTLTRPSSQSDHVPFREAGIPGLLLTWRESSEENLPDEMADPVLPYRLGVTGRMLALTLMALAG